MVTTFAESETKKNLMRAFAGESLTRNRYTFAAEQAKREKLYVIEMLFRYTAAQEKAHAEVFYGYLNRVAGENIVIDWDCPVDIAEDMGILLRKAQHNEYEECDPLYKKYGEIAQKEGYPEIASAFQQIARVEEIHGDRFRRVADLLEKGRLFVSDTCEKWICLNCGCVFDAKEAPAACPVCRHSRGYFVRFELSPFTCGSKK